MEEKITLSKEQWAEIDGYLFEEKKLLAIKTLHLFAHISLKESQEIIEQRFEKLLAEQPEKFNPNEDDNGNPTICITILILVPDDEN